MANSLTGIFGIKNLRDRIFFTIFILVLFRLGTHLTIPGINPQALSDYFHGASSGNAFADQMDFFVGGGFTRFSLFMLGVSPYITTQILLQLAMLIFPSLKKISEEDGGRRKINQWTRIATVVVALLQSTMVVVWARNIPGAVVIPHNLHVFITLIAVTTGTMITVWLGEQITARGIGNGISVLIFAGIVARLPGAVWELFTQVKLGRLNPVFVLIAFLMFIGIVILVIYENQGQRKIPVNYAKRVIGRKMYGGQSTYIPFKLNPSGVMPVIFAQSFLMFPLQIATMLGKNITWLGKVANALRADGPLYLTLYVLLIVLFGFFYTQITLNPTEISRQIRENGGSIPGVRADRTEEYLQKILNRLVFPGTIYLAFIAVVPTLIVFLFSFPSSIAHLMGGTSLLILVGVDLDTMAQVESLLRMHHHDGLVKKGRLRGRNL